MALFAAGAEGLEAREVARQRKTAAAAATPFRHATATAIEPVPSQVDSSTVQSRITAVWPRRVRGKRSMDALQRGMLP
eukprot:9096529-Karenia_brevis.AAC.1